MLKLTQLLGSGAGANATGLALYDIATDTALPLKLAALSVRNGKMAINVISDATTFLDIVAQIDLDAWTFDWVKKFDATDTTAAKLTRRVLIDTDGSVLQCGSRDGYIETRRLLGSDGTFSISASTGFFSMGIGLDDSRSTMNRMALVVPQQNTAVFTWAVHGGTTLYTNVLNPIAYRRGVLIYGGYVVTNACVNENGDYAILNEIATVGAFNMYGSSPMWAVQFPVIPTRLAMDSAGAVYALIETSTYGRLIKVLPGGTPAFDVTITAPTDTGFRFGLTPDGYVLLRYGASGSSDWRYYIFLSATNGTFVRGFRMRDTATDAGYFGLALMDIADGVLYLASDVRINGVYSQRIFVYPGYPDGINEPVRFGTFEIEPVDSVAWTNNGLPTLTPNTIYALVNVPGSPPTAQNSVSGYAMANPVAVPRT